MYEVLELINSWDLPNRATALMNAVDAADPRLVAVAVVFLLFLGARMVSGQQAVRAWGLRVGLATFLIYGGITYYHVGNERPLSDIALHAANAGGCVLAVVWIFMPVVAFVFSHLRLALAAFLGYGGYQIVTAENFQTEQLPEMAGRSLMAAGLVLLVAWIVHPIWDFFSDLLPQPARRAKEEEDEDEPPKDRPLGRRARLKHLRKLRRRRRALAEAPKAELEVTLETTQPEPASLFEVEAQRRRDKARLKVEVLYILALPEVESRLPRPMFDDFVQRYLGDHLPPEDVEENTRQLLVLLQQYRKKVQATNGALSLEDLARRLQDDPRRPTALDGTIPIKPESLTDLPPAPSSPIH